MKIKFVLGSIVIKLTITLYSNLQQFMCNTKFDSYRICSYINSIWKETTSTTTYRGNEKFVLYIHNSIEHTGLRDLRSKLSYSADVKTESTCLQITRTNITENKICLPCY